MMHVRLCCILINILIGFLKFGLERNSINDYHIYCGPPCALKLRNAMCCCLHASIRASSCACRCLAATIRASRSRSSLSLAAINASCCASCFYNRDALFVKANI